MTHHPHRSVGLATAKGCLIGVLIALAFWAILALALWEIL